MEQVIAMLLIGAFGAGVFLCGVVVGHRLTTGLPPVAMPEIFKPPEKEESEPEEQGWAMRTKPHVDEVI